MGMHYSTFSKPYIFFNNSASTNAKHLIIQVTFISFNGVSIFTGVKRHWFADEKGTEIVGVDTPAELKRIFVLSNALELFGYAALIAVYLIIVFAVLIAFDFSIVNLIVGILMFLSNFIVGIVAEAIGNWCRIRVIEFEPKRYGWILIPDESNGED